MKTFVIERSIQFRQEVEIAYASCHVCDTDLEFDLDEGIGDIGLRIKPCDVCNAIAVADRKREAAAEAGEAPPVES